MANDTPATAEGDLGRTPFAHLLVYAVDKRLTGAMFLSEPGQEQPHVVRFVRGAAVKIRPADRFALLGEMLVEAGALSDKTLADALATKGLLGDMLLLTGCVDRDVLESTCLKQFVKRMTRLFLLPPATTYRYFEGHPELEEYGGEPAKVDPLALLWMGLKAHGGTDEAQERALARLGETPLRVHVLATLDRFGLGEEELKVVEHLRKTALPLAGLLALGLAPEERVKRFCYAMLITRQIEVGANVLPVGAESPLAAAREATATVGRVQLKATKYRLGAAAPDLPGTGERTTDPSRTSENPRPKSNPTAAKGDRGSVPAPLSPRPDAATLKSVEPLVPYKPPRSPELAVLSAPVLYQLAQTKLAARDFEGALEACSSALVAAGSEPDYVALSVWIRFQMGRADLKSLLVELDELLRGSEGHVQARFYRAMLRRKMGDDSSAIRDLRRVLELSPSHAEAARELEGIEPRKPAARSGLLGWLFKR